MKQPQRRGLTRPELAAALGVSRSSVDRWIERGLRSVGRRGQAKLYRPADARKVAAGLKRAPAASDDVLIGDHHSHALDLGDRTQALVEQYVADEAWLPLWRRCCAAIAKRTASWPGLLTEAVRRVPAAQRPYLRLSEGIVVAAPVPAPALLQQLGMTEAQWRAQQPTAPAPVLRPLLTRLATWMATSREVQAVARAVEVPAARGVPPTPTTAQTARAQWRNARAAYRQQRVAVRRGHRRREDVSAAITQALTAHTRAWWQGWRTALVESTQPAQIHQVATRIQREALEALGAVTTETLARTTKESRR